jgi:hypothetical protein
MGYGSPVEAGGFRLNPEELDSYKIDYSEESPEVPKRR